MFLSCWNAALTAKLVTKKSALPHYFVNRRIFGVGSLAHTSTISHNSNSRLALNHNRLLHDSQFFSEHSMSITLSKVLFLSSADDLRLDSLADAFELHSLELSTAADVQVARRWIEQQGIPHLLMVDVSSQDSTEFVQEMMETLGLPIITIGRRNATTKEAVEALQYADDFIRREYTDSREIALRSRRVLSRMPNFNYATGPEIRITDWLTVDHLNRQVKYRGEVRKLTPTENALLNTLLNHRGTTVDADRLIEVVWRLDPSIKDRNALRVHVHRLRNKLEEYPDNPAFIMTERGIGYSFTASIPESVGNANLSQKRGKAGIANSIFSTFQPISLMPLPHPIYDA